MAAMRPAVQTSNLPVLSEDGDSSVSSPARGRPMINNLVSRFRPIPLVHTWIFWHEKPASVPTDKSSAVSPIDKATTPAEFASQLTELTALADVKGFWSSFNNISFPETPLRHSYHLFHDKVKPLWEDPRNAHGGCWTFRVPKPHAESVFQTICLLAIGEQLQEAVHEEGRVQFKDDICGVSFCMRMGTVLIKVWNRDAGHEEGIQRIRDAVERNMPDGIRLNDTAVFYKPHRAHDGFEGKGKKGDSIDAIIAAATSAAPADVRPELQREESEGTKKINIQAKLQQTQEEHDIARHSIDAMENEVDRVKKILEDVNLRESEMQSKLADGEEAAAAASSSKV